jgi:hypothetical protein
MQHVRKMEKKAEKYLFPLLFIYIGTREQELGKKIPAPAFGRRPEGLSPQGFSPDGSKGVSGLG